MDHGPFIQQFQELQYGIIFERYIGLGFSTICYSAEDTSVYWNYAFCNSLISKEQLIEIEAEFSLLVRQPAFYFEKKAELSGLSSFLEEHQYKKGFEKSWLFFEGEVTPDESLFHLVKKVETTEELAVYLDTFTRCYVQDDPQNPYGELGGYLHAAKNAWLKSHEEKIEYFVVFQEKVPVAVCALTSYEGLGYISNVGSLPSVRGKGFGKLATLYCVWKSQQNGNTSHFLITEEGTYPHQFYQRIGFTHRFYTEGYINSNL